MELLANSDAAAWCAGREVVIARDWRTRLRFADGYPAKVRLTIPSADRRSLLTAYMMLTTGPSENEEENFGGALLWLHDWGMWSETLDDVGLVLLRAMRRDHPGSADIASTPAHHFSAAEFVEARATTAIPLLFQWDAHLVPDDGSAIYAISHDGYVDMWFRTPEIFRREVDRYAVGEWELQPLDEG
jgi:hypothetical protein